jgi:hypothetical protein
VLPGRRGTAHERSVRVDQLSWAHRRLAGQGVVFGRVAKDFNCIAIQEPNEVWGVGASSARVILLAVTIAKNVSRQFVADRFGRHVAALDHP